MNDVNRGRLLRRLMGLGIGVLCLAQAAGAQRAVVYRVPVTGTIENGLAPFVARAIAEAGAADASLVILDIDTPGGRIDAAERIVDAIRGSRVPVVAWIHPRAWSAGAMIALAADQIYVTPGGALGAATPVDGSGTKASEKMVSAMRAEFRSLAEARGRDPALAEAMVDESLDIPDLAPTGKLLSVTARQAIDVGLADGEAASLDEVLAARGLSGAEVLAVDPNWAEWLVRFLTNPVVAPLLLSLGVLGLIFEIKAGAFGLGGLVSLASLGLFFGSSFLLGLAGWEEVLMLGAGLLAVAVEVLVIPGFGVAGMLGLGLIGGAVVMALLGAAPSGGDIMSALAILGTAVVITAAVFFAWLRHLPNSTRWSGLLLKDTAPRGEGYLSAPDRPELVGRIATALTDLRPSGTAELDGERIDVVTEGDFIKSGSQVTILRAEGYRHVVRPARPVSQLPA
jgi:membrane-bound serine protease (ClpP class)